MATNTQANEAIRYAEEITRSREILSPEAWRATFAEFIATLLFVFLGAGSVVVSGMLIDADLTAARLILIALAHGFAIALLAYATAHISGGHINPAVTFAAVLTRKISMTRGSMFVAAQIVGGVIGALLVAGVVSGAIDGNLGAHALGSEVSVGQGLLMEIIISFALVFVIFATAIDPKAAAGNLAPLAIGLTVLVTHLLAVPITGASMNPARSFGPALVSGAWSDHWIYWLGPLIGAAIAGLVYRYVFVNRRANA